MFEHASLGTRLRSPLICSYEMHINLTNVGSDGLGGDERISHSTFTQSPDGGHALCPNRTWSGTE